MTDSSVKHGIDTYMETALVRQINTVFGVQAHFTLRSDFSDVLQKVTDKKSDRTVGLCFLRPTGLTINREGFRPRALAGRGIATSVARKEMRAGVEVPTHVNLLHLSPTIFEYDVSFYVATRTDIRRLWALWSQAVLKSTLDFTIRYQDTYFDIAVSLTDEMSMPELGAKGEEREDQAVMQGTIQLTGYTNALSDAHVVPLILEPSIGLTVRP